MRVTVLPSTFLIQDGYGPCSLGGSLWQRQVGLLQRVVRSTRLPGGQAELGDLGGDPSLATSAGLWLKPCPL